MRSQISNCVIDFSGSVSDRRAHACYLPARSNLASSSRFKAAIRNKPGRFRSIKLMRLCFRRRIHAPDQQPFSSVC